jgi:hypothetical protein
LSGGFLVCGCGGVSTISTNDFPVVVFSDIHFNPFYDPSLFAALNSADVSAWLSIFKTSSITAPSALGYDTNYPLLAVALSSVTQNLGASPIAIYTGDLLGHGIPQLFAKYSGSSAVAPLLAFTDKVVAFVMQQIRSAVGNIPVVFAVGNLDSYSGYGPDSTFLSNTAELFYTQFLNGTADHQRFLDSFKSGGYYSVEMLESKLMVIGINTILFSPLLPASVIAAEVPEVTAQFAWLDAQLAAAQTAGQKVWLLMHVPPGADEGTTASSASSNGQITSASMMWNSAYQATFLEILAKYPGLIALTLAGHTHMDEYRIMSPGNSLEITPGISPVFKNDPAFKVFTFSLDTLRPIDYSSMNYDLSAMPAEFNHYYTFSTAYSEQGTLSDSLARLFPRLVNSQAQQALYRSYYYSGNVSSASISNATWPVYWAGIGKMTQQEIIDAVNSYY